MVLPYPGHIWSWCCLCAWRWTHESEPLFEHLPWVRCCTNFLGCKDEENEALLNFNVHTYEMGSWHLPPRVIMKIRWLNVHTNIYPHTHALTMYIVPATYETFNMWHLSWYLVWLCLYPSYPRTHQMWISICESEKECNWKTKTKTKTLLHFGSSQLQWVTEQIEMKITQPVYHTRCTVIACFYLWGKKCAMIGGIISWRLNLYHRKPQSPGEKKGRKNKKNNEKAINK